MENKKTPRERFVAELEGLIEKFMEIDNDTPWQETEPEWWLAMNEIERYAMVSIKRFKSTSTPKP